MRQKVFIVAQNCIYPDIDGHDPSTIHLFAKNQENDIVAYIRIFEPEHVYEGSDICPHARIGRVVVAQEYRGQNLGRLAMEKALAYIDEMYG